jgi:hypothetical protein
MSTHLQCLWCGSFSVTSDYFCAPCAVQKQLEVDSHTTYIDARRLEVESEIASVKDLDAMKATIESTKLVDFASMDQEALDTSLRSIKLKLDKYFS